MRNRTAPSRWRRVTTSLAVAALSAATVVGSAGPASAEPQVNSTPASAIGVASLPFESSSPGWRDAPEATDPAAQVVAAACNDGNDVYGTAWWKYTGPTPATFVVHAGDLVGGVVQYQPVGLAVVSGDLGSVRSCGEAGSQTTGTGATTIAAGESVYIVAFLATAEPDRLYAPVIGVYPSTGVAPSNDSVTAPTVVGSLPFSVTQDTTLATRDPAEPACYSKFGVGPSVWYSVTPSTDQLLDLSINADYETDFVVVPGGDLESSSSWLCGERQIQAQAGVTYLIGVYGFEDLHNSGQLSVTIAAAPAAPAVKISLASSGTAKKTTGAVTVTGTITCTAASTAGPTTGSLRQVYHRSIHQQDFSGSTAACTGKAVPWTAKIVPTTFLFRGKTQVLATVTACSTGGCTTAVVKKTVALKVA